MFNPQPFIDTFGSARVKLNEPLSNHTYIKIGGPADILIQVNTRQELIDAYTLAKTHHLPIYILGSGSNIIVADGGIRGLVIKNRADQIKTVNFQGGVKDRSVKLASATIEVESGVITNHLVRYTIDEGLAGLEYFLGIPGTVGGAVYNNSHYQQELIGNHIKEVLVLTHRLKQKVYTQSQLKFAYDFSILQLTKELVLSATFTLAGGDKQQLWDKATGFAKNRAETQPLSQPNSGCMFQNLSPSQVEMLGASSASTGSLIDQAGLKGIQVGGAQISTKHANFVVNTGAATAADVKKLISLVKRRVKAKFGITLKPEVFFVGDK